MLISLRRMLFDFYPRSHIVEKLARLCCACRPHAASSRLKAARKKALTSNGEWFDTFEFGSKNGIATQSGDEDDTFAADAPLADAAFGK